MYVLIFLTHKNNVMIGFLTFKNPLQELYLFSNIKRYLLFFLSVMLFNIKLYFLKQYNLKLN